MSGSGSPRVVAVVVSYNVRELLIPCVESLEDARYRGELDATIVVDNASNDGSVDAVRSRFPGVTVIEASNRGYGAGANTGIAASDHEYVLILNPDTVVQPGTIKALSAFLNRHPFVAIVAPRLRYPDGTIQPTRRRFPERLTPLFESTILAEWLPDNRWANRFHMRDDSPQPGEPQQVDWVVGAAMMVRRAAIDDAGGFDESFRMYSEEVEWCWRLHSHGWSVAYQPCVEITHYEGSSTRQDIAVRQVDFDTSRVRLARRMYGDLTAEVIRVGLLAGYGLIVIRESIKWLLGHRRGLRDRRIRLYLGALRHGLRDRVVS